LVGQYGTKEDFDKLELILPDYKSHNRLNVFRKPEVDHDSLTCKLPEGYIPFGKEVNTKYYKRAYSYLVNERKVTQEQIDKYKIGYTESGPRKFRIIIPSYNRLGKINYYEARSYFSNSKMSYYKPDFPNKDDIIFNEKFINWDLPIYLVEGPFDMLRIPNSIPLLGKSPSDYLMVKIFDYKPKVVLCLDEDAIKDSIELYQSLSSMGIDVYFIDLIGKGDVSSIYEEGGQEAILELLKTKARLNFEYFLKRQIEFKK
jgi:cellulose synthase/poly-beta-1,6-N-acetylglucosamine synthase-like glycosyltransferase